MRIAALLLMILPLTALPTAAQVAPVRSSDPAYARFEAAVDEAKQAMMGDPRRALVKADHAIVQARELPPSGKAEIAIATAEWLKAESLLRVNQIDSALPMIDQALGRVAAHAPKSKLQGDLMRSRGAIASLRGRTQEALLDFQRAYAIFTAARVPRSRAIALQDIGQIYWEAGDHPSALKYYSESAELYSGDPSFTLTAHDSQADVLRALGRHAEAEGEYLKALDSARRLKSPMLEVQILSDLAVSQVESGRFVDAQRTVDRALRLAQAGEAQGGRPFVLGAAAIVAAARNDFQRAGDLLRRTFSGVDFATSEAPFKEFHELGATVAEKLGDDALALRHFKAFQRLDSDARNLTASAAAQLMAARFDFQNQDLKIQERDARIKKQQAEFRSNLLTGLVVAGSIVLVLLLVSALRIRRSRNEVRAANVVLGETNEALGKALKAKTEFLATTSHEIRTPLNGILGMTQILLANRKLEREVREQVQVVHGAGESMRALVDDILDVAKMETGQVTVASEEVKLRVLLDGAARLWSGHAEGKGVALVVDTAGAPMRILSDEARLRQIVSNLLSNAIKFTAQGSVTLRAAEEGEELVVVVRDTGIGIPGDQLDAIFEAFHQVDGGTTRQFAGTGLGLSICRNLAEAMGGTIEVDSRIGEGSTFTLRVPLVRLDSALEAPGHRFPPSALADARVLVVEANAMKQGVLRALIEPAAASVECVEDAAGALAAIDARMVDHLLVEGASATLADCAALDSLRALVEAAGAADIPVTILVAPSESLPLDAVAALGANRVVLKPVGGAQLVAALHEAYAAPAGEAAPLSSAA